MRIYTIPYHTLLSYKEKDMAFFHLKLLSKISNFLQILLALIEQYYDFILSHKTELKYGSVLGPHKHFKFYTFFCKFYTFLG